MQSWLGIKPSFHECWVITLPTELRPQSPPKLFYKGNITHYFYYILEMYLVGGGAGKAWLEVREQFVGAGSLHCVGPGGSNSSSQVLYWAEPSHQSTLLKNHLSLE